MKYISLCVVNCHLNRCENILYCSVCAFIGNLQHLYAVNVVNGNVENLQKFHRDHRGIFFKLRSISQSLAMNDVFKNLLEQLNVLLSTKENGVDFKKVMKKIGEFEVYDLTSWNN